MWQLEGLPIQVPFGSEDVLRGISTTASKPALQQVPKRHEG